MDAAATRFFDLPELTHALGAFLSKGDVATLVRTSRHFKTLFEPWLYRDLTLSSYEDYSNCWSKNYGGLLRSRRSVIALSTNAHLVWRLSCGLEEIPYLFNCLLRHQDQTLANNNNTSTAAVATDQSASLTMLTSVARPNWVPPPDLPPPSCRLIPIAPMRHLVHLKMDFKLPRFSYKLRYRMSTCKLATTTAVRKVCWIIQQSPHLLSLDLSQISVTKDDEMQMLAGTIQSLICLQDLRLFIRGEDAVLQKGFYRIFFALPSLLRVCKMTGILPFRRRYFRSDADPWDCNQTYRRRESENEQESEEEEMNEQDLTGNRERRVQEHDQIHGKGQDLIPEVFHRSRPLSRLEVFRAWNMTMFTNEEILAVFDHCPIVERLRVPRVSAVGNQLDNLARSISQRCPHLRFLTSKRDADASLLLPIMTAMPSQQLEEVKLLESRSVSSEADMRRAFGRHSTTLRKVDLRNTDLGRKDLLVILDLCGSLEILRKHGGQCDGGSLLSLADAISVTWASKRIRHLEMTIGLPEVHEDPYYKRSAPVALSDEERRYFSDLEIFYRQIGSLKQLEYIDLRAMHLDEEDDNMFFIRSNTDKYTFPGMLSLQDDETGRPGYLDLLAGLVKLRELRGSVRATTDETKVTIGEREMEWMATHWPALKCVALFTWNTCVEEPFERLRDVLRPGISLAQY